MHCCGCIPILTTQLASYTNYGAIAYKMNPVPESSVDSEVTYSYAQRPIGYHHSQAEAPGSSEGNGAGEQRQGVHQGGTLT